MPGADPVTTGLETLPLVILFLVSIVMLKIADRRDAARAAAEANASASFGDGLDPTHLAMLFDLRSRGRRRTVQAVYLGLAIILGGGLVLFGVGAGNGIGGLLNAFKGGGSSSDQSAAVSQQEKAAIKATLTNPNSAAAWAALVQARWSQVRSSTADLNPNTGQFTAAGKKELSSLTQDYQRYKQLAHTPDPNVAILAARACPVRRQLRRLHQRLDGHLCRVPERGHGVRMPGRERLRRRPDPHGRPGVPEGPEPRAQGPAHPAPEQDRPGQDQSPGRPELLTPTTAG